MAIAYGSQGDGGGTESNGASLDLACPASVAANDILIAHVTFEGLTNAPSTPSGWTKLYGPAKLGNATAVGRSWVFGKLADGTEDGSTIGFGSHANTSGRYGRIYSFTGYTSGTITEITTSWNDLPSEGSIPLPGVATLASGGLAVALLVQDDNNSFAAAGAVTGGTWAEPVAEFVSASLGAQGCIVGIQTSTPTGDPGKISGGTANATADEGSSIGFAIHASKPSGPAVVPFNGDWEATSTPKTVDVYGCLTGDVLLVTTGGPESASFNVSAATTSTTAGSTGSWTELLEDINTGANECWIHCAYATVSSDGDVTVSVARTQGGTPQRWGVVVFRCRGAGTPTLEASQLANGSTEALSATVGTDSAVVSAFHDWDGSAAAGTAPTPTDGLRVEALVRSPDWTPTVFYWLKQASGTRNYGTTDNAGTSLKGSVVEIPAGTSDQAITPQATTVSVTPGTATVVREEQITPAALTVSVTPGTLVVSPQQNITPAALTVSVTPGSVSVAQAITPAALTVSVTPGSLTLDMAVTPAAVSVSVTPGTLSLAQAITPAALTVDVTPGSVSLAQSITPGALTISVTPGSLQVAQEGGDQAITPAALTVSVTPGTATVVREEQIVPAALTVSVTPGTLSVAQGISLTGATVSVTPGAPQLDLNITPAPLTVSVTPGTVTVSQPAQQDITPAPVVVSVTPGTLNVAQGVSLTGPTVNITPGSVSLAMSIAPTGAAVSVTPGSPSLAMSITPSQVLVGVTPGTLTVTPGAADVSPAAVAVSITPGTLVITGGAVADIISRVSTGHQHHRAATSPGHFRVGTTHQHFRASSS
jgi:hypothetical protein